MEEREIMPELVYGFSRFVVFVDGTNEKICNPTDAEAQLEGYDSHHNFHCFAMLL